MSEEKAVSNKPKALSPGLIAIMKLDPRINLGDTDVDQLRTDLNSLSDNGIGYGTVVFTDNGVLFYKFRLNTDTMTTQYDPLYEGQPEFEEIATDRGFININLYGRNLFYTARNDDREILFGLLHSIHSNQVSSGHPNRWIDEGAVVPIIRIDKTERFYNIHDVKVQITLDVDLQRVVGLIKLLVPTAEIQIESSLILN